MKKYRKYYDRVHHFFSQLWYWIRTHTYNRYHIINIKNADHEYKWGWIDSDNKMELACFKIMVDYVEGEEPFERLDLEATDSGAWFAKELREIYHWWKFERKKEHDANNKFGDGTRWNFEEGKMHYSEDWQQFSDGVEALDKKDDEMFERLIKIRHYMWT